MRFHAPLIEGVLIQRVIDRLKANGLDASL